MYWDGSVRKHGNFMYLEYRGSSRLEQSLPAGTRPVAGGSPTSRGFACPRVESTGKRPEDEKM